MMNTIWIALIISAAVWLTAVAIAALVKGIQSRTVRLRRDGIAAGLPILGLVAYVLIAGVALSPVAAVTAFLVGSGLGFFATWRNGSLPALGLPVVWASPWQMALLALSGVVASVGALGAWETVLNAGLLALCAAVGFGAGAYGYGVGATLDARKAFDVELRPTVTCPGCRQVVRAGMRLCAQCGQTLPEHCSACGSSLVQPDAACKSCGSNPERRLPDPAPDEVTVRFCHACSVRVPMDAIFCHACATLLAPACPLCGAPATLDDEICSLCDIELGLAVTAVKSGLIETIWAEVEAEFEDAEMRATPEPLVQAATAITEKPIPGKAPAAAPRIESNRPDFPPPPAPQTALPQVRFCGRCGTEAPPETAFCVRCGSKLE